VVDNSQGDAETEKVARKFGARYKLEPKAGLNHARKRGLDECKSEAVAFLDDDAIPQPDWLGTLLASSARKKGTGSADKVLNIELGGSKVHQKNPASSGKKAEG
jgi:glycosyltransferase involved in cell wall biosynthesis